MRCKYCNKRIRRLKKYSEIASEMYTHIAGNITCSIGRLADYDGKPDYRKEKIDRIFENETV
jgi:hypothetical protein